MRSDVNFYVRKQTSALDFLTSLRSMMDNTEQAWKAAVSWKPPPTKHWSIMVELWLDRSPVLSVRTHYQASFFTNIQVSKFQQVTLNGHNAPVKFFCPNPPGHLLGHHFFWLARPSYPIIRICHVNGFLEYRLEQATFISMVKNVFTDTTLFLLIRSK